MKVQAAPVIAVACCLQISCATPDDQAARQPREEGVYLTGSRIPQRTTGTAPISNISREGWEDATRGHKQINPQGM